MMMIKVSDLVRVAALAFILSGLLLPGLAAAATGADIYQQNVPQMTTLECAKCHLQVFEDLRDRGGQHKQQCRDCHQKFHTFTPGVAWEDRVPACVSCHDYPHGEEMTVCLECHKNAHAPIDSLVVAEKLSDMCERCHSGPTEELQQADNLHAGQSCFDCHQGERHGLRPACNSCHEQAHSPFVDNVGCVACHPPHNPTQVRYDTEVENAQCGSCHQDQVQVLTKSSRKHKLLTCVVCHPREHMQTLTCQQCHETGPHNPALLKNFSGCSDCHGSPHQLRL